MLKMKDDRIDTNLHESQISNILEAFDRGDWKDEVDPAKASLASETSFHAAKHKGPNMLVGVDACATVVSSFNSVPSKGKVLCLWPLGKKGLFSYTLRLESLLPILTFFSLFCILALFAGFCCFAEGC